VDTESDTLLVSSEGHLLIGQAKLSHQANYTCVAENIAAKRLSEPVSLTVYGKSSGLEAALRNCDESNMGS
jgi:leucine-rich repeat transmembrane protein FLRT